MSKTPRTDAVVGQREYGNYQDSEYARLARTLELELAEQIECVNKLDLKVAQEIGQLRADKARLDWLEITYLEDRFWLRIASAQNIRQAIDAAMNSK